MSLETWIKEFYPESAIVMTSNPKVSPVDIIKHSLQKWRGLSETNRARHDVKFVKQTGRLVCLIDSEADPLTSNYLPISDITCSLCQAYECYPTSPEDTQDLIDGCDDDSNECPPNTCPLWLVGQGCETEENPWTCWIQTHNPEPMVTALEELLKETEENGTV